MTRLTEDVAASLPVVARLGALHFACAECGAAPGSFCAFSDRRSGDLRLAHRSRGAQLVSPVVDDVVDRRGRPV